MKKLDILKGLLLGLIIGLMASFLIYILISKGNTDFELAYAYLKHNNLLGKVITLGAIPNLFLVYILFNKNKEVIARGVILSLFVLTILTLIL